MKYIITLLFILNTLGIAAQDMIAFTISNTSYNHIKSNISTHHENEERFCTDDKSLPAFFNRPIPGDSLTINAGIDSAKRNIPDHAFKFEFSSLFSNLIVMGGEYIVRDRFTIEHWIGSLFDFSDEYTKKTGFVLRTGVKWYLLNNYDLTNPLAGFYVKGELAYTKVTIKELEGYQYFLLQSPVYSQDKLQLNNYAVHFYGGYQAFMGKHLTMDMCAGIGTSLPNNQNDLFFDNEESVPGTFPLVNNNRLTLAFSLSLGRAF